MHVLTQKGRGYAPAEEDDIQRLHDVKGTPATGGPEGPDHVPPTTYTHAFTRSLVRNAETDPRIVAITAAMPGPTGLLPFEARFPDRFLDVGIAEQHAVTAAAGLAMGGMRPVVAVYSTFFTRAFDQANLDVGLHRLPVVFALDRAGITGDDGPSHHGVLDMALGLAVPGMTVFAPSSAHEVETMLETALGLEGPAMIRFPKTPAPPSDPASVGSGLEARLIRQGDGSSVCLLAVGKMLAACEGAAALLADSDIDATVWDVRVVSHPDQAMLADAAGHRLVVTVEDGIRQGGAGMYLAEALRASLPTGAAPPVVELGIPRAFLAQGKADRILAELGLDAEGVAATVHSTLKTIPEFVEPLPTGPTTLPRTILGPDGTD